MSLRSAPPEVVRGWEHPTLRLHQRWYGRRRIAWQARLALALLVLIAVPVLLGASPIIFLFCLLAFLVPPPLRREATLREIEQRYGPAYTTALVAPAEDEFGFGQRLARQARTVAYNADIPPLPWLEGLAAVLIVTLALVLPGPGGRMAASLPGSVPKPYVPSEATPESGREADPVVDAGNAGTISPPAGARSSGKAASSGAPAETSVGEVKPGEGEAGAVADPEAVTREYLQALERGSVRTSDPNGAQPKGSGPRVEDRDLLAPEGDKANGEGSQGKQGTGGQQGKQRGQQGQGGSGNQQNGKGSQDGSGDGGRQGNQQSQGDSGSKGGGGKGKGVPRGAQDYERELGGEGGNQGYPGGAPDVSRSQPGRGGLNAGGNVAQEGAGQGKSRLEYLPGEARGSDVRSGALQLPGDPSRPFTLTPGSPEFKRAVEGAVLDPRLPPEYQELLRNYYR